MGYQVSAAVEAEMDAVKRVTTEITKLKKRKNADMTAIRSWRFKYRAWKMRVTATNRKALSEDSKRLINRLVSAYNRSIEISLPRYRQVANKQDAERITAILNIFEHRITKLQNSEIADEVAAELEQSSINLVEARGKVSEYYRAARELKQHSDENDDFQYLQQRYEQQRQLYDDYQVALKKYHEKLDAYEDYRILLGKWQKKHDQWEDDQRLYLKADEWLENRETNINVLNQNEYAVALVEEGGDYSVRVAQEGLSGLSQELVQNYTRFPELGLDTALTSNIWNIIGQPDWGNVRSAAEDNDLMGMQVAIQQAIYDKLSTWVEDQNNATYQKILLEAGDETEPQHPQKVDKPIEPEPVKKPQKPEKTSPKLELEPVEMPEFTATITLDPALFNSDATVDEKLVDVMDSYATGPYSNTRNHFDDVNALATELGNDCPTIEIADTRFNNETLMSAIDELEESWNGFGGQQHSEQGTVIVNRLKAAIDQLRDATDYQSLDACSVKFSESSTQLFVWFASNWWQQGGKPEGDAHPWKGTGARVLKR